MPVKRPNLAEYNKQAEEITNLKASLLDARGGRDSAQREVERLRSRVTLLERRVGELEVERDTVQEQLTAVRQGAPVAEVAGPSPGPSADDARWAYSAEREPKGKLFRNLAAEEEAEKDNPGYWHPSKTLAYAAFVERVNAPLAVEPVDEDEAPAAPVLSAAEVKAAQDKLAAEM